MTAESFAWFMLILIIYGLCRIWYAQRYDNAPKHHRRRREIIADEREQARKNGHV